MNQFSQYSGGRDGCSNKISLGNGGDEDNSRCSDLNFFFRLLPGIFEVALLSSRNADKIHLGCIQ